MTTSEFFADKLTYGLLTVLLLLLAPVSGQPAGPPRTMKAYGGVLELTDPSINYRLDHYVKILPDSAGRLTVADVSSGAANAAFQDAMTFAEAMKTNQLYWGSFTVVNRLTEADRSAEWVLYFSTSWTALEVYTADQEGGWRVERDGFFLPNREKVFAPSDRGNLIKLSLPPGSVRTIYFRGKGERKADPPSFNLRLESTEAYYQKLDKSRVGNAVFLGFLGMMLLYNLIVYFFVRDRSYIYYFGYLLMMIIYAAYSNDDLTKWFGNHLFTDHPQYFAYFKLSVFFGLSSYLAFIRSFLRLDQLLPKWDTYFRLLSYIGLPLAVIHIAVSLTSNFSHVLEDRISVPYIGLVIGSCMLFLYPLFRTGDKKGYFIFAGISAISLGAVLVILSRVVFPPFSVFYLNLGVVIEVLTFSLGLAYQQRMQIRAKDRADFDLRESQLVQERQELEANLLREDNRKNALLAERSQENEVLLKEIHHRVKNNLEVVSSLLELQSVTLTDGDARAAMLAGRSRVTTMGLLHQKLYQGDHLGTVGMREYFSDLTRNLGHTFGIKGRVTFTINVPEDLRLDIDTAVPLGLIANELITNSIKYAFVGEDAGAVEVEMSRVGERYLLAVSDNGSGKAGGSVGGTGFGTRLVGMLVQQLEGELREIDEDGLRVEVLFWGGD